MLYPPELWALGRASCTRTAAVRQRAKRARSGREIGILPAAVGLGLEWTRILLPNRRLVDVEPDAFDPFRWVGSYDIHRVP
jgi:hypothetical protein